MHRGRGAAPARNAGSPREIEGGPGVAGSNKNRVGSAMRRSHPSGEFLEGGGGDGPRWIAAALLYISTRRGHISCVGGRGRGGPGEGGGGRREGGRVEGGVLFIYLFCPLVGDAGPAPKWRLNSPYIVRDRGGVKLCISAGASPPVPSPRAAGPTSGGTYLRGIFLSP